MTEPKRSYSLQNLICRTRGEVKLQQSVPSFHPRKRHHSGTYTLLGFELSSLSRAQSSALSTLKTLTTPNEKPANRFRGAGRRARRRGARAGPAAAAPRPSRDAGAAVQRREPPPPPTPAEPAQKRAHRPNEQAHAIAQRPPSQHSATRCPNTFSKTPSKPPV